jgi:hypothetical protein
MSSTLQLEANRQNAQLSTGPVTEEGKQRSSQNATRHGFTGQSLVITDAEKEAYEAHVQAFQTEYSPDGHIETNLVQQLADLHWSIHQIFVQQANLTSLLNAITVQLAPANDPLATANALTPHYKSLNTLGIYDQRRRRAAKAVEDRLLTLQKEKSEANAANLDLAAKAYQHFKAKGETWDPAEYGFVYSLADIEDHLVGQSLGQTLGQGAKKPQSITAWIAEHEASMAKLR